MIPKPFSFPKNPKHLKDPPQKVSKSLQFFQKIQKIQSFYIDQPSEAGGSHWKLLICFEFLEKLKVFAYFLVGSFGCFGFFGKLKGLCMWDGCLWRAPGELWGDSGELWETLESSSKLLGELWMFWEALELTKSFRGTDSVDYCVYVEHCSSPLCTSLSVVLWFQYAFSKEYTEVLYGSPCLLHYNFSTYLVNSIQKFSMDLLVYCIICIHVYI